MTNALGNNQILVYHRANDGNLTSIQIIATGGGGSGLQLLEVDSLGSSGSMQLNEEHHLLFAVNTESAAQNTGVGTYNQDCTQVTITSFRVASDGTLTFADRVFSGGLFPNSLTVKKRDNDGGDLLYVLNAGGPEVPVCHLTPQSANRPNITGFTLDRAGHMTPVGSVQPIDPGPSAGTVENCVDATEFAAIFGAPVADFACGLNPPSFVRSPAQVQFTPDGNRLVVTVKGTNTIYVFRVDNNGRAASPTSTQASFPALPTYFAVTFDKQGHLLVSEINGSATTFTEAATGAVSSFTVTRAGQLVSISSHVADGGAAACWIALEPASGKYAFVTNSLEHFPLGLNRRGFPKACECASLRH
jgi:6-phosphogluconolactonase (cycloisomerase 2 family)